MRYTTAIVAAALASTTLAAGHGHAAHHRHHEREAEAAAEPEPTNYTYSDGQCWGDMGCSPKTGDSDASVTAQAVNTAQTQATQTQAATSAKQTSAAPASKAASSASKATGSAASPSSGSSSSGGNVDVTSLLSKVTQQGMKAAVSDGSCVKGTGNKNVAEITNKSGKDIVYVCWGSAGSWVNAKAPIMALGIGNGQTETISFADTPSGAQGGACSVVADDTQLAMGQISNTWLEATFNQWGTVDVSREVNANGIPITAKCASGCTTSMTQCVFKCTNGATTCGTAGSYQLENCSGTGANTGSIDGGCQFGTGKMEVTIG